MTATRRYLDNAPGQLHVWQWRGAQGALPPIVCLPPVPYGGRFFDTFAQAYGGPVWSADLPGYGFSDALVDPPTVGGYTDAMTPVSYTHLRAHETRSNLVCRLLLEKKN